MTSIDPGPFRARSLQDWHSPQGVGVGPCSQFRHRARIRALVVFPHPRGPLNCAIDPVVPQRLLQRVGDMLLPDDLGERRLRAIAAVQRERRHTYEVIGAH